MSEKGLFESRIGILEILYISFVLIYSTAKD